MGWGSSFVNFVAGGGDKDKGKERTDKWKGKAKKEIKRTVKKVKEDPGGLTADFVTGYMTAGVKPGAEFLMKELTPKPPEMPSDLMEANGETFEVPSETNVANATLQDNEIQSELRRNSALSGAEKRKKNRPLGRAANLLTGYSGLSMDSDSGLARKTLMGY